MENKEENSAHSYTEGADVPAPSAPVEDKVPVYKYGSVICDTIDDILISGGSKPLDRSVGLMLKMESELTKAGFAIKNITDGVEDKEGEKDALKNEFDAKFCYLTIDTGFRSTITPDEVFEWFYNKLVNRK